MRLTTHRDERGELLEVGLILVGVLVVLALVGGAIFGVANAMHVEHQTCTVIEKDRARGESGSDARLYTDECGVLSVGDSLFEGHWSSADTYQSIDEGKTYDMKTRGWRVPFLSMFPNAVKVKEVNR